jgi:hypothetical protein
LQDANHVCRQRPVRTATQICDVDSDPPARLENSLALVEDVTEHLQILQIVSGDAVAA